MGTLTCVYLGTEVLNACIGHALSSEYQEIMGLLLGKYDDVEGSAIITRVMVLTRKDKKKDRVEVSTDHLALASSVAEQLAEIDNEAVSIIGWYHSHPHITVFPSHVDCRTQGLYQSLDSRFIGLIFSVYNLTKFDVCAFQSRNVGTTEAPNWVRMEVPVIISSPMYESKTAEGTLSSKRFLEHMITLNYMLLNEERMALDSTVESFGNSISSLPSASSPLRGIDIMHLSSAYSSSIAKFIEIQLFPLLTGLQQQLETKTIVKQRLLEEIRILEEQSGTECNSTTIVDSDSEVKHLCNSFSRTLSALRTTGVLWNKSCLSLRAVFRGVAASRVCIFDVTCDCEVSGESISRINWVKKQECGRVVDASLKIVSNFQMEWNYELSTSSSKQVSSSNASSRMHIWRQRMSRPPWKLILQGESTCEDYGLLAVHHDDNKTAEQGYMSVGFVVADQNASCASIKLLYLEAQLTESKETVSSMQQSLHTALRLNLWV